METEAIVLDTTDYGESDLIVRLLGKGTGRITAIAKGARRSKRRFVNKLEIFSFLQVNLQLKPNRSLAFLEEAELHTSFLSLRKDFRLYSIASVIREILLLGTGEGDISDDIFGLSLWSLHRLNTGNDSPSSILVFFLIRFLDHIGYRPDLEGCSKCGKPFEIALEFSFDLAAGSLICPNCRGTAIKTFALSPGTIKMLQASLNTPLPRLHQLKIPDTLRKEALAMLYIFCREILQKDITSWNYARKYLTP